MPVQLPTNFGKADYNVVLSLQKLADGVNQLEAKADRLQEAVGATGLQTIRTELRRLTERVDALSRAVEVLQQAP